MKTAKVDLKLITSFYNSIKHDENVVFSPFLVSKALGKTSKDLPQDPEISLQLNAGNQLVNTIAFKQYADISNFQDEEFTTSSGEILKVEMYHAMKPLFYNEDDDLKATITSFIHKGSNCMRLFMILPDQDSSIEELERKLSNISFEKFIGRLQRKNVFVQMPMFKVDTVVDLAVSEFLPGSSDCQTSRIQQKVSFGTGTYIVPPKPIHGPLHCSGIIEGSFVVGRPVIFFVASMSNDTAIDDVIIYGKLSKPLQK